MSCSALLMMPTVVMPNSAEVRAYQKRLRVGVADAADAAAIRGSPGRSSSNRVRNGVFSIEWISRWNPVFAVEEDHACTPRSQMGVVVDAEEHVQHHIVVGCSSEESAHCAPFVIG